MLLYDFIFEAEKKAFLQVMFTLNCIYDTVSCVHTAFNFILFPPGISLPSMICTGMKPGTQMPNLPR